jgi:hypothetical protein
MAYPLNHYKHVIAWTYADNQYILFDANEGEQRFNHFNNFKSYLHATLSVHDIDLNFKKKKTIPRRLLFINH